MTKTSKTFKVTRELADSDKCPPQARLIVSLIKANGGSMFREDLLAALKRPKNQGGLETVQSAERVLGFYIPKLGPKELNVVEVEETKVEVADAEGDAPEKPAKAKKASGKKDKGAKGQPQEAAA